MDRIRWYLITNYIVIQVLALVLAYFLWGKEFKVPEPLEHPSVPLILIGLLVIFVIVLLLLVRCGKSRIVCYAVDYVILLVLIFYTLLFLGFPLWISAACSGLVVILRHAVFWFKHVSVVIFVGITAAIAGFLPVYSVVVLVLVYFLFDILFAKSKHIRKLTDDSYIKNSSLIFTLDIKKESFIMGSADMILPSVLVVSAFMHWFTKTSNVSTAVAGAGLVSLFILGGLLMATRKKETPAMPYASVGIIGFLIVEAVLLLL
jgi:presenilin-like A22 family membrane protease